MKKLLVVFAIAALLVRHAVAESTIDSTNAYSYGANLGWMNWKPGAAQGVNLGEYICSGFIYGGNVGWISLGNGAPANHIQYSNASGEDFGINYKIDAMLPGKAILRGYAYGANVGWITFEEVGNPRLRFSDGRLEGYAYSANCGWINLGDGTFAVQTDVIAPGIDTDHDGMADAFEHQYLGGLAALPALDTDGDGVLDVDEYLAGTSPLLPASSLRVTASTEPGGATAAVRWTSTLARLYRLQVNSNLADPLGWEESGLGLIIPDIGSETARTVQAIATDKRFYRVRAVRPLEP